MTDDKRKKKRGRPKLFRSCFRSSAAAEDKPLVYDKSDDRNPKNGRLRKPVLIAVSGRKGEDFITDVNLAVNGDVIDRGVDCYSKRSSSSSRSRFGRVLKAVVFDSLMVKKISRSSSKSSHASDTSTSYISTDKIEKPPLVIHTCVRECNDADKDSYRQRSNLLSSSSQTTCSSYTSSTYNSNSQSLSCDHQKPPSRINDSRHKPILSTSRSCLEQRTLSRLKSTDSVKSVGNNNNWSSVLWSLFFLLSLVVLVVYGRIYSILCTSIWFYFVPCRRIKRVNSVTDSVKFMDTDSEQYKKRVIMAGLLDRTRNQLR